MRGLKSAKLYESQCYLLGGFFALKERISVSGEFSRQAAALPQTNLKQRQGYASLPPPLWQLMARDL